MSLQVGQKAPNFSLYDTEKNKVNLTDFSGKNVVVLFFPLAFTGVCTKELCTVRDNIALYNNLDAVVLAISVDSFFTLQKFKQEQNLNFSLLSDFNKEASASYDVLMDLFPAAEMRGVSKRAAFVVNPAGNLSYTEICELGVLPNFEAIQAVLKG
ncbi:MAG: redoxin domain-containing protein [Sediminibacterium sp.]|nr:redoxin domain-containing protein [Sediminibacterium sp.]